MNVSELLSEALTKDANGIYGWVDLGPDTRIELVRLIGEALVSGVFLSNEQYDSVRELFASWKDRIYWSDSDQASQFLREVHAVEDILAAG